MLTQTGIVVTKISLKLCLFKKYNVDFPDMENSHEFILNLPKDLRKWCHENFAYLYRGMELKMNHLLVAKK